MTEQKANIAITNKEKIEMPLLSKLRQAGGWLASTVLFVSSLLLTAPAGAAAPKVIDVCSGSVPKGWARCESHVRADHTGKPLITTQLTTGYGPDQFHKAYALPTTAGVPVTVAVVVAYDNPKAKVDLDSYSQTYGLPVLPYCSSGQTSGCFEKFDQQGTHNYPSISSGWALESDLDLQTIHGVCQDCRLILVEANSASLADLAASANEAVALGANVVSNSYGGGEYSGQRTYDSAYHHSGVTDLAAAGDSGYGVSYPASYGGLVAVGGTTLNLTSSGGWKSETVWAGTGSGCSRYETKPSWQTDSGCTRRTVADIAADADPNTGAAVYDSYGYGGQHGWFVLGGTSLSAPLVAGAFGLSGSQAGNGPSAIYASSGSNLRDIVQGRSGRCYSHPYLCTAESGYDGPSGWGTMLGLGAL